MNEYTNSKLRVGVIFGGKSAEHEVSLRSAQSIVEHLDPAKYIPVLVGIDHSGIWHLVQQQELKEKSRLLLPLSRPSNSITLAPQTNNALIDVNTAERAGTIDVAFPVLHGSFGEDGSIQGMLTLANIPFVGAGVLGSAIGMDKDVTKRLLREAGIPIANFITAHRNNVPTFEKATKELGSVVFVKPANAGSSIGVHKIASPSEYENATKDALQYDTKIIIEEAIVGREIECSVLGGNAARASILGEIIPRGEFYSYEAKYIDEHGAELSIPANLPNELTKQIQALAIRTFEILCCDGMARVDFFLREDGKVLVNEINTIPGFTTVSMYPKLWEATGVSYTELLDTLIQLALEKHAQSRQLKTSLQ